MSVVPPAGTHSYCTEGEYLLATPGSLYVLALACRGPTLHEPYLLTQQNVHKVRNSLTPQPCGAFPSMLLLQPRSTSSYMLLPRLATSSPAPSPKGNASTTAVHWMARMARAEALREGSAVPLLSLPQVSTESPAFASFHIGTHALA